MGGPSIIFDKSALQMLSPDESVWLEMYFIAGVTPIFYVETLADLEKVGGSRDGAKIVGELASKTPSGMAPIIHHGNLVGSELAGQTITMDGRPVIGGGSVRRTQDGKVGVFFEDFPERAALDRWQRGEFEEIERGAAKEWRRDLAVQDHELKIGMLKNIVPTSTRLNSLEAIKAAADAFCESTDSQNLRLMLEILGVTRKQDLVVKRWETAGRPRLIDFLPYSCHVFKVDLVYYLGVNGGFISSVRVSNKADLAYLYYLPFTMVFVTGDKLQLRVAPLFLGKRTSLVNATDLKVALKEMDDYHDQLPDEVKAQGVMSFAGGYPPPTMDNVVTRLWDTHMRPDWRDIQKRKDAGLPDDDGPPSKTVREMMDEIEKSTPIAPGDPGFEASENPDILTIERRMFVHRGKWRMVSKEIEEAGDKKKSDQ